jgi:hypothetical protein
MRIKRRTLAAEREGGRVYVLLGPERTGEQTTNRTADPRDELIAQLRAEVEAWREEARRKDHLLAAALERIPPQLEAPPEAPREATEEHRVQQSPPQSIWESLREEPERAEPRERAQEPSEALGGPGSGTARGSWWRRMFGG